MKTYLKTGVPNLDRLLDMDDPATDKDGKTLFSGGILVNEGSDTGVTAPAVPPVTVPPVTLISGEAGTGKTTLLLQMASSQRTDWNVFLYSLEQSEPELSLACKHFGFITGGFEDLAQRPLSEAAPNLVKLCHLSPVPLGAASGAPVFEERFSQLSYALGEFTRARPNSPAKQPVVLLDSLNAFGSGDLQRHDLCRLFALFRSHKIPAVATCEAPHAGSAAVDHVARDARFLADIVIDLRKEPRQEYVLFDLEISKNRRTRQALGRHLYKIRTTDNAKGVDEPAGVTVYPSISSVLTMARQKSHEPKGKYTVTAGVGGGGDLWEIIQAKEIPHGSCIAVTGPRGTHKRALALNLATGALSLDGDTAVAVSAAPASVVPASPAGPRTHLLVLSFGVYAGFNFKGTAWFEERRVWRSLKDVEKREEEDEKREKKKTWTAHYSSGELKATVLTFQVGNLSPEECFDRVNRTFASYPNTFSAVLLSDTGEICTGFPLLRRDPLFIPTLIDLIHSYGLVSVAVGVGGASQYSQEMDSSLLAMADYRVSLSHFPDTYELAKGIVSEELEKKFPSAKMARETRAFPEQASCMVVDNVSGQHYGRTPRWLWVTKKQVDEKTLHCGSVDDCLEAIFRPQDPGGCSRPPAMHWVAKRRGFPKKTAPRRRFKL